MPQNASPSPFRRLAAIILELMLMVVVIRALTGFDFSVRKPIIEEASFHAAERQVQLFVQECSGATLASVFNARIHNFLESTTHVLQTNYRPGDQAHLRKILYPIVDRPKCTWLLTEIADRTTIATFFALFADDDFASINLLQAVYSKYPTIPSKNRTEILRKHFKGIGSLEFRQLNGMLLEFYSIIFWKDAGYIQLVEFDAHSREHFKSSAEWNGLMPDRSVAMYQARLKLLNNIHQETLFGRCLYLLADTINHLISFVPSKTVATCDDYCKKLSGNFEKLDKLLRKHPELKQIKFIESTLFLLTAFFDKHLVERRIPWVTAESSPTTSIL